LARDAAALQRAHQLSDPVSFTHPAADDVERRAAEILADTQAALDDDLLEQAHGLAMTLVPHTAGVGRRSTSTSSDYRAHAPAHRAGPETAVAAVGHGRGGLTRWGAAGIRAAPASATPTADQHSMRALRTSASVTPVAVPSCSALATNPVVASSTPSLTART
jgi:hypothetical protein